MKCNGLRSSCRDLEAVVDDSPGHSDLDLLDGLTEQILRIKEYMTLPNNESTDDLTKEALQKVVALRALLDDVIKAHQPGKGCDSKI